MSVSWGWKKPRARWTSGFIVGRGGSVQVPVVQYLKRIGQSIIYPINFHILIYLCVGRCRLDGWHCHNVVSFIFEPLISFISSQEGSAQSPSLTMFPLMMGLRTSLDTVTIVMVYGLCIAAMSMNCCNGNVMVLVLEDLVHLVGFNRETRKKIRRTVVSRLRLVPILNSTLDYLCYCHCRCHFL